MGEPALTADQAAVLILNELLAVKATETVAIVTDPASTAEMVMALTNVLQGRDIEYSILAQPNRTPDRKNDLNPSIAAALGAVDVMVALTKTSGAPIYSVRIKELIDAKSIRFMSMVMRDMDIFTKGGATADYRALHADGVKLKEIWSNGRVMRITSAAGTDISAPIAHDDVLVECGYATQPGTSAAFSDGEVSSRPLEGTANGVFVIDGPGAVIGTPDTPIALHVTDGRVTAIDGTCPQADHLRQILDTVENADNIAEFGIGLNPACRRNGKFEEEKKRRGQVHIAIGDNIIYGGTTHSAVHLDLVLRDPTVTLDGQVIVDQGHVKLDQ
ncbi:MAG: aminopeptidase [Pseudomonadota bacterium]